MSSTFWFLLEFTVLLALAAGVFAWLGWMWRGSERGDRVKKLQAEVEEQRRMARTAMDERDAARAEVTNTGGSVHVSDAAPLIQANEALESENIRLREERKTLEARLATLQADNAHLFSQSSASLAEALKKTHQLEADLAVAQAFASEVSTLRQQLADAKVAHQSEVSTIQQKLDAADSTEDQLSALRDQNTSLNEELQKAQTSLAAANAEKAAIQEKLAASTAEAQNDLQTARSEISALEQKLVQTTTELQKVQNEIAALQQKLAEAPPPAPQPVVQPVVEAPAPAPAPKVEKAAPKPRATKKKAATSTAHNAQEKLAQIETALAPQLAVLAALTQERDDWQRRVTLLESKTPPDLAGLGLSRRSLASSAERLSEAQAAVESLQNQQRALHKTIQQATDLASQPDDDLTKIKGIKGVLSEQLHALGIRTWRQIAEWNDDDLRAFSELLAFKNRATRDHWQEQAKLLAQP
ncbi:MAG: hypothetical protein U1F81_02055 [Verrucomicrobiaceae bacterium]